MPWLSHNTATTKRPTHPYTLVMLLIGGLLAVLFLLTFK
jgi:hypothetical protein